MSFKTKTYVKDAEFFRDEKPLFIRVEDTMFCMPPYYFDDSEVYRCMFSLPLTSDGSQDGSSEDRPLLLEGIQADHFRDLLRVLSLRIATLPASENLHKYIGKLPTSWAAVLDLATRWEIPSVRGWAIKYLKREDCFTRLAFAYKYDISEWRATAMKELAMRESPLTVEEFNTLGVGLALKVVALREEIRTSIRQPTIEELTRAIAE